MPADFSSAETAYMRLNGLDLAYKQFGAGEPILFYNRFRGILDTWDPLFLDALANHYQVTVFDYPGVGNSQGELSTDLIEVANAGIQLMDSLGHEQFHVGGWSYGGQVAQVAMFLNQEKVVKSILIGCNPPGRNRIRMKLTFGITAMKATYDLEDEIQLFFEPNSEKSRQAARESHERIVARVDPALIPADKAILKRYRKGMRSFNKDRQKFRAAYKTLKTPVLVISGDNDRSFNAGNWFPLFRKAPSIQHLIMHDAGHGSLNQYPELAAKYIHLFLSHA